MLVTFLLLSIHVTLMTVMVLDPMTLEDVRQYRFQRSVNKIISYWENR